MLLLNNTFSYHQVTLPDSVEYYKEGFMNECERYVPHNIYDADIIGRAFDLCYVGHKEAERADGSPFFTHPVEVAKIAAKEFRIDSIGIVSSLLHDIVEDTEIVLEEIKKEFGVGVSNIIDGLTKISGVIDNNENAKLETLTKLLFRMADDIRVILIKLADRLHNIRTIEYLPSDKRKHIALETLHLYAPLAHRLGLFRIKNELEDLSFKVVHSNLYKSIANQLNEKKRDRERFIEAFTSPIKKNLEKKGFHFEIKGRPKHIYSIYRKMMRQKIENVKEIYDLFAIRIILEYPHNKEDCWRVYSNITDWYTPVPHRFRDLISVSKANGYQSLHTTVLTKSGQRVEVQIRTRKMDKIAECGVAAHWDYKESRHDQSQELSSAIKWIRDVLGNCRTGEEQEFMQDFHLNFYEDEIYAFTPKGEIKILPKGATALDFAFSIHSEVGMSAVSSQANGKWVPLSYVLSSGDQVKINTQKNKNVNPDWLNIVITHRAKLSIRRYLRLERRKIVEKGGGIWEKKCEKMRSKITKQDLALFVQRNDYSSIESFFYALGLGDITINNVVKRVRKFLSVTSQVNNQAKVKKDKLTTTSKPGNYPTKIYMDNDEVRLKYHIAECCRPIPGDGILGFNSRNGYVKVHRSNCSNLKYLISQESDRIMDVYWGTSHLQKFLVELAIIGDDRLGIVKDILTVLSKKFELSINHMNVTTKGGIFHGQILVYVKNIQEYQKVIEHIRLLPAIHNAYRILR